MSTPTTREACSFCGLAVARWRCWDARGRVYCRFWCLQQKTKTKPAEPTVRLPPGPTPEPPGTFVPKTKFIRE